MGLEQNSFQEGVVVEVHTQTDRGRPWVAEFYFDPKTRGCARLSKTELPDGGIRAVCSVGIHGFQPGTFSGFQEAPIQAGFEYFSAATRALLVRRFTADGKDIGADRRGDWRHPHLQAADLEELRRLLMAKFRNLHE